MKTPPVTLQFFNTSDDAKACIEYILDTESEDFYENPDENHVCYHALRAKYGKEYADKRLHENQED